MASFSLGRLIKQLYELNTWVFFPLMLFPFTSLSKWSNKLPHVPKSLQSKSAKTTSTFLAFSIMAKSIEILSHLLKAVLTYSYSPGVRSEEHTSELHHV